MALIVSMSVSNRFSSRHGSIRVRNAKDVRSVIRTTDRTVVNKCDLFRSTQIESGFLWLFPSLEFRDAFNVPSRQRHRCSNNSAFVHVVAVQDTTLCRLVSVGGSLIVLCSFSLSLSRSLCCVCEFVVAVSSSSSSLIPLLLVLLLVAQSVVAVGVVINKKQQATSNTEPSDTVTETEKRENEVNPACLESSILVAKHPHTH